MESPPDLDRERIRYLSQRLRELEDRVTKLEDQVRKQKTPG